MPRTKRNSRLLQGARVYLSGPMDFVASRTAEKQSSWRNRVSQFLQEMGVTVFDPWFKPEVRVEARQADVLSVSALATGPETYRLLVPNIGSSGQDGVSIQWDGGGGVLKQSPVVTGPFTSVTNGVGGDVTLPNDGNPTRFFRVYSP